MNKGKFIVFEGIDGSGKTTQAKALEEWLTSQGISVWRTAEPTNNTFGRQIRDLFANPLTEENKEQLRELFRQDRIQHLFEPEVGITSRLDKGQWVICDRYIYSTLVYQGNMEKKFVEDEHHFSNFVIVPDVLVYISVDSKEAYQRVISRNQQLSMFETCTRLEELKKAYWELLRSPNHPCHFLQGTKIIQVQGLLTRQAQTQLITNVLISKYLELKQDDKTLID